MASLELDKNSSHIQIRSYQPGAITVQIGNQVIRYTQCIIVTATEVLTTWSPHSFEALTIEDFTLVNSLQCDVLLIGTGSRQKFLPMHLQVELLKQDYGVEVMETGAACRTFNALISENRNVAAALIL